MKRWLFIRISALAGVAGFFYAGYFFTNWLTAQRQTVPEVIFAWEHNLPFIDWTIIPYWSLNLLYGCGYLLCRDTPEVRRYSLQLLAAQLIACIGFLSLPLQISWPKPTEPEGVTGFLFSRLAQLDQPYNQAPSLHIILSVVVGALYLRKARAQWLKWLIGAWFMLIGVSVLTTFQHHFIDVPTGVFVGCLVLSLIPAEGRIALKSVRQTPSHRKWAAIYAALAALTAVFAWLISGGGWWLLWPAGSFALLTLNYLYFGVQLFRKRPDGSFNAASVWLFLPYLLIAGLNARYWIDWKREKRAVEILPEIYLGSILAAKNYSAVFDVTAEIGYRPRNHQTYHNFPLLDMVTPTTDELSAAAEKLNRMAQLKRPLLICCALGYGRSIAVLLAWLVCYRQYSPERAIALVRVVRPKCVINLEIQRNIARLAGQQGVKNG